MQRKLRIDWIDGKSKPMEFCWFWKTHYRKSAFKSKYYSETNVHFILRKKKLRLQIQIRFSAGKKRMRANKYCENFVQANEKHIVVLLCWALAKIFILAWWKCTHVPIRCTPFRVLYERAMTITQQIISFWNINAGRMSKRTNECDGNGSRTMISFRVSCRKKKWDAIL